VTDTTKENKPATVPEAKQAGEPRDRWKWVEPTVWTERMLSALEEGVKGGKWYSLMDMRDHLRWPNAYFEEQGLITLESAIVEARQSSTR
jgi:hypothetical protein